MNEYPKHKHSRTEGQRLITSREEEDTLSGEWFDTPDFRNIGMLPAHEAANRVEYPKYKYPHNYPNAQPVLVRSLHEEEALVGDWYETPNDVREAAEAKAKEAEAKIDDLMGVVIEASPEVAPVHVAKKAFREKARGLTNVDRA